MGRERRQAPPPAWTIGHSTLTGESLIERLSAHRIEQVADVRRYPASRRLPQFGRAALESLLESHRIRYRWFEALGGRRSPLPREESPNTGLTSAGFRGYADYMQGEEFRAAFEELVAWLAGGRTAILCAEVLWWRCHRRLLADRLASLGGSVRHIRSEKAEPHRLWDLALVTPGGLVYPPAQAELGFDPVD